MNLQQIYNKAKQILNNAQIDSFTFDVMALMNKNFGVDRNDLIMRGTKEVSPEQENIFFSQIEKRATGFPLQYLLETWTFMDMDLIVGEGVLIPREDTEILVTEGAKMLKGNGEKKVLDLCSGSGAVGLGIVRLMDNCKVTCVELSGNAVQYLKQNIASFAKNQVEVVCFDVLKAPQGNFETELDAIFSNPPYITAAEMQSLQKEVTFEPAMALYGGDDGLIFYRAIEKYWLPLLKRGGVLGVEIGYKQGEEVSTIFSDKLEDIRICKDINGLDRVVIGKKK